RQDGRVRLTLEKAGPSEAYYAAKRKVTFRYEFAGSSRRDLRIQVVKKRNQEPVRAWVRENVEPREGHRIRWGGSKREGGPVNSDKYMFRIREVDGEFAERSRAQGRRIFTLRQHKFPVRGRHSYGDGFGAGRGHQGVDIFARCGTPLIAARAGRVQYRGYHSSAGNYTVIDGRGTRRDYVYMHLKQSARFAKGRRVKVGQTVGRVGETGNASGCHLHFEIWNGPGWYEGGSPSRRVKPILRDWDDYS
nr:peptidoglycan DD-metalloendopeptidase family protein [Solirubrobacterales bacterium]